jgi:hypothetical protein
MDPQYIPIVWALIVLGFFLLIREFWVWYWKINKRINLLEDQNELLEDIKILLGGEPQDNPKPEKTITRGEYARRMKTGENLEQANGIDP